MDTDYKKMLLRRLDDPAYRKLLLQRLMFEGELFVAKNKDGLSWVECSLPGWSYQKEIEMHLQHEAFVEKAAKDEEVRKKQEAQKAAQAERRKAWLETKKI